MDATFSAHMKPALEALRVTLNKSNSMPYGTRRFIPKGSPINPILNRINPIPRIDTYFCKIHYNIVLPSAPS